MEITTWYYTLSTIAQSAATMIAFGAAFVVFKLSDNWLKISDYRKPILRTIEIFNSKLPNYYINYSDQKIIKEIKDISDRKGFAEKQEFLGLAGEKFGSLRLIWCDGCGDEEEVATRIEKTKKLFENLINYSSKIIRKLKIGAVLVGITLILGSILLVFSDSWVRNFYVLVPYTILFCFCVVEIISLVIFASRNIEFEDKKELKNIWTRINLKLSTCKKLLLKK